MSFEFSVKVNHNWSSLKEKIIDEIKKNSLFYREYDYDGNHWYEFRTQGNTDISKMPEIGIIIKDTGLYIARYKSSDDPWHDLENIKDVLKDYDYSVEEL